eukprot:scaffold1913_cov257-Pinguiococcus_pyrenoidosus.AAC.8
MSTQGLWQKETSAVNSVGQSWQGSAKQSFRSAHLGGRIQVACTSVSAQISPLRGELLDFLRRLGRQFAQCTASRRLSLAVFAASPSVTAWRNSHAQSFPCALALFL